MIIGAIVAVLAVKLIIGFGGGGVAARSLATWMMSIMTPIAAGSIFALLQSAGAGGLGTPCIIY